MARRLPPGTKAITTNKQGGYVSVRIQASVAVSRSNPANNFPQMRAALMNNIHEKVAKPLAADMVRYAKTHYPWEDQKPEEHSPERGYPNDHASRQIKGGTGVGTDIIAVSLEHSPKTFQDRTDAPRRRRGKGGSGMSREELDEQPERRHHRSPNDRRVARTGGAGSGTPLGEGEREIVYYGNILEFGHGGDEGTLQSGKFGILTDTWRRYQERFLSMMQGDMLEGIDFSGATQPAKKPKSGRPNGRSIKVTRR